MMPTMLFRRLLLASVARTFAAEALMLGRARSRRDHLQNGAATMVGLWSELAWRPDPLSRLLFVKSDRMRSELRYALDELRRAVSPPPRRRHTKRLVLIGVPSAAVALAFVARARTSAD